MVKQKRHKSEWVFTQRPEGYNFEKDFGDCVMFVDYEFQKSKYKKPSAVFTDFMAQHEEWKNLIWEHVNKARVNKPLEYTAPNIKIVFRPAGRVEHVLERVKRYDQPAVKGNPLCSISGNFSSLDFACLSTAVSTYLPPYEEVNKPIK